MENNLKIGKNAQIQVEWEVQPVYYNRETEKRMISIMADRYGVSNKQIKIIPKFIKLNSKGEEMEFKSDVIDNIQDPKFQVKLFQEYIKANGIKDADFDKILNIDNEINAKIDYDVYDKFRRYTVKWIEFKNFLSYGPKLNRIDFNNLKGLVQLSSEPKNQGGKSTLSIDLLKFLLFGSTSKTDKMEKIFNKRLPDETEVLVKGEIDIDGESYIIERIVSRPKKRSENSKASQKVKYFRVINGEYDQNTPLEDYEPNNLKNEAGEHSLFTNKIIKEAIGKEQDYDLIINTNAKNLAQLVDFGQTELNKTLYRWIGLMPIEVKNELARNKYNKEIVPSYVSKLYDRETLKKEIEEYKVNIKNSNEEIVKQNELIKETDLKIKNQEKDKDALLLAKTQIDDSILKLDITTLNKEIEEIKSDGVKKRTKLNEIKEEIKAAENIPDNSNVIKTKKEESLQLNLKINNIKNELNTKTLTFDNNIQKIENELKTNLNTLETELKNNVSNLEKDLKNTVSNLETKLTNDINSLKKDYALIVNEKKGKVKLLTKENEHLISLGDKCPTCGKDYDNQPKINANKIEITQLEKEIKDLYAEYTVKEKELKEKSEKDIKTKKEKSEKEINDLKISKEKEINDLKTSKDKELTELKSDKENSLKSLRENKTKEDTNLQALNNDIEKLEVEEEKFLKREKDVILKEKIQVDIENLLNQHKIKTDLLKEYNKNKDSIDKNNQLDIQINNINVRIETDRKCKENYLAKIKEFEASILSDEKDIKTRELNITKLIDEEKTDKAWKLYLDMVGKNGISKMVLRNTIPIINGQLKAALNGICDFDVELNINDKNEIKLLMIDNDDETVSDLTSASGFEMTVGALALRMVLAKMSTLPRPNYLTIDEVFAGISTDNIEKMKGIFDKMKEEYQFILHICHVEQVSDWHNQFINVKRDENKISYIEIK